MILALLVIGTSVVLAGQAIAPATPESDAGDVPNGGRPLPSALVPAGTPGSRATPVRPSTPVGVPLTPELHDVEDQLVTTATIDLAGTLPDGLAGTRGYRLRIYVNDELVRERRLPRRTNFTLRAIPLEQGPNVITAAISGSAGEGLHSRPIEVVRDDLAPVIRVMEPRRGVPVYDDEIVLRGRSEPGAMVEVVNETTAEALDVTVDEAGGFDAPLTLVKGDNEIRLRATDLAGNRAGARITLRHEEGGARAELTLSDENMSLGSLPATIVLRAHVTDNLGDPVDGAEVTFSLSPPGQSTSTYRTTTDAGTAVWRGVRIPREGTLPGQGFATVLVLLPDGNTLQGSATFTIR